MAVKYLWGFNWFQYLFCVYDRGIILKPRHYLRLMITLHRKIALHTVWLIFWWICPYFGIPKLSLLDSQQTIIWANTSSVVLLPAAPWSARNLERGGRPALPLSTRVELSEVSQSLSLIKPATEPVTVPDPPPPPPVIFTKREENSEWCNWPSVGNFPR